MQKDTKHTKGKDRTAIKQKDIQSNPDPKIDQDFPGHPHAPATKKNITPSTPNEKEISDINNKDGEKRNYNKKEKTTKEQSAGSANALEETERLTQDAKSDKSAAVDE